MVKRNEPFFEKNSCHPPFLIVPPSPAQRNCPQITQSSWLRASNVQRAPFVTCISIDGQMNSHSNFILLHASMMFSNVAFRRKKFPVESRFVAIIDMRGRVLGNKILYFFHSRSNCLSIDASPLSLIFRAENVLPLLEGPKPIFIEFRNLLTRINQGKHLQGLFFYMLALCWSKGSHINKPQKESVFKIGVKTMCPPQRF